MSADSPQAEINPYASPVAIPAGAEEAMPAEVLFGLERPIRAAGTLTRQDIRLATRLSTGMTPKYLVSVGLMACGLGFFAWEFTQPVLLVVPAFFFAIYAFIWMLYGLSISWGVQDACCEHEELLFGETEVQSASTTLEATLDWRVYSKCTCTDTHVLLHLHHVGECAVLPRSFFACDSDWLQLVALVKHKLPEKKSRPAPEPAPAAILPIESDEWAIHGQVSLAYRDLLAARKNVVGRWRLRVAQLVGLAIVTTPLLVAMVTPSGPDPMDLLVELGAVAWFGWIVFIAPRRLLRRLARRHQGPFAVGVLAVSEEGVSQKQHFAQVKFRWSYFVGHRQLPQCILLDYPSRTRTHILARSYFSEADWPAVVALVERKLPRL